MKRVVIGLLFAANVGFIGMAYGGKSSPCGPRIEGLSVVPGVRLVLFAFCTRVPAEDVFYG